MTEPSLSNVCPYCFHSITFVEYPFKLWPPWMSVETCPNCGKRFGRDKYGRTVKFEDYLIKCIIFVACILFFAYLLLKYFLV